MSEPLQSKVHIYKHEKPDLDNHVACTKFVLDKIAFAWQIEIAATTLCGEDVIVDVGTSCGKTLAFQIPLVLDGMDIVLRVTPLTTLMIDQVCRSS